MKSNPSLYFNARSKHPEGAFDEILLFMGNMFCQVEDHGTIGLWEYYKSEREKYGFSTKIDPLLDNALPLVIDGYGSPLYDYIVEYEYSAIIRSGNISELEVVQLQIIKLLLACLRTLNYSDAALLIENFKSDGLVLERFQQRCDAR